MYITYLIGNGFDVNLGLNTRYVDFYKYYIELETRDAPECIQKFKSEITEFIKAESRKVDECLIDWRDLEVALGLYTKRLSNEDAETIYINLIDSLKDYLLGEYRKFDADAFDKNAFYKYLLDPVTGHFNRVKSQELKRYWGDKPSPDFINVINFNYTSTIEDLTGFNGKDISLGDSLPGHKTNLHSIHHIHQSLNDDEILVGVNDVSQIANEDMRLDSYVCDLLVKPNTNALLGTGVNNDCEAIIASSQLLVLFGSSAGVTDKKWWKAVIKRLADSDARLIYFVHLNEKPEHWRLKQNLLSEEEIRKLIVNAGLEEDKYFENIFSRCYVSFTDNMFKLPVTYGNRLPLEKSYQIGKSEVNLKLMDINMKDITLTVDAPDEKSGVAAEREWIKEFFPDFTFSSQSLFELEVDGKKVPFDELRINKKRIRKSIYFDISSFFGKGDNFNLMGISADHKLSALKAHRNLLN